jgi:hypothetical protein
LNKFGLKFEFEKMKKFEFKRFENGFEKKKKEKKTKLTYPPSPTRRPTTTFGPRGPPRRLPPSPLSPSRRQVGPTCRDLLLPQDRRPPFPAPAAGSRTPAPPPRLPRARPPPPLAIKAPPPPHSTARPFHSPKPPHRAAINGRPASSHATASPRPLGSSLSPI